VAAVTLRAGPELLHGVLPYVENAGASLAYHQFHSEFAKITSFTGSARLGIL
jgi:hypothetical protein